MVGRLWTMRGSRDSVRWSKRSKQRPGCVMEFELYPKRNEHQRFCSRQVSRSETETSTLAAHGEETGGGAGCRGQLGSSCSSSGEHVTVRWAEVTEDREKCTGWRDSLGNGLEMMSGREKEGWWWLLVLWFVQLDRCRCHVLGRGSLEEDQIWRRKP